MGMSIGIPGAELGKVVLNVYVILPNEKVRIIKNISNITWVFVYGNDVAIHAVYIPLN